MNPQKISSITVGPRQSNIELLRLVAMFLVLIVHADFQALGEPRLSDFSLAPLSSSLRVLFQSIAIVAVNTFVFISGWFGIRASMKGFCGFLFQCLFFTVGTYILALSTGLTTLSGNGISQCLMLSTNVWFVKAYMALYILSPVLNAFIERADKRHLEYVLLAFFIFQSIYGWYGAAKFVEQGYSCFSFIGIYLLASYIKHYGAAIYKWGGVIYITCVIINSLLYIIRLKFGILPQIYAYANPLNVAGALGLFLWFNQMDIRNTKLINITARSAFAVYLFHTSPEIFHKVFLPAVKTIYDSHGGLTVIIYICLFLISVYLISIILDRMRILVWNTIINNIKLKCQFSKTKSS